MWLFPQPQSRKQYVQFGVVILCLVCLLPTRLVWHSQKWRLFDFSSLRSAARQSATKGISDSNSNNNNRTAECRFFPEALFQFSNDLHDKPEPTAVRPWALRTTKKYPAWHFPGLSSQLLDDAFRGKRVALVGDSTLFLLQRWMHTLLYNTSRTRQDALVDLDMTAANYAVNPDMDDQVGWSHATTPELRLKDGTAVVWDGHRGEPGGRACYFEPVWQHMRQLQPHVLVINFGLHWLHLMGAGRNVPLCYVQAWLSYEVWLADIVKMANESGVKLLLFKTNNFVCTEQFWGDYADGVALYEGKDAVAVRNKCRRLIQTLVRDNTGMSSSTSSSQTMFTPANISRYCERAVFSEFGVKDLNHRLLEFVHRQQQQHATNNNNMTMAIFNDHDLQSCAYSAPNDGRHYHPLNLMRIRLLANMIQCLYPKEV